MKIKSETEVGGIKIKRSVEFDQPKMGRRKLARFIENLANRLLSKPEEEKVTGGFAFHFPNVKSMKGDIDLGPVPFVSTVKFSKPDGEDAEGSESPSPIVLGECPQVHPEPPKSEKWDELLIPTETVTNGPSAPKHAIGDQVFIKEYIPKATKHEAGLASAECPTYTVTDIGKLRNGYAYKIDGGLTWFLESEIAAAEMKPPELKIGDKVRVKKDPKGLVWTVTGVTAEKTGLTTLRLYWTDRTPDMPQLKPCQFSEITSYSQEVEKVEE